MREFRFQLKQFQTSIDELKEAPLTIFLYLKMLSLSLDVKSGLAERLLSHGDYKGVMNTPAHLLSHSTTVL